MDCKDLTLKQEQLTAEASANICAFKPLTLVKNLY